MAYAGQILDADSFRGICSCSVCIAQAVLPLLDRQTPGISHLIFAKSIQITPFAALSRAVSGIRGQTLVLTFPGSPKAVKENFEAVVKMLPHAIDLTRGGTGKKTHEKMQGGPRPSGATLVSVDKSQAESSHSHGHGHGHGGHTCFHHSDRETRTDAASLGLGTPGMYSLMRKVKRCSHGLREY